MDKHLVENTIIDYIQSLIPPDKPFLQKLYLECKEKNIPIIEPEVQQLLVFLLKSKQSRNVLEIGTAVGYSAIVAGNIIKAHHGKITTIERNFLRYEEAQKNFYSACLTDIITPIHGDAKEILSTLKGAYDFIFLDAAKGQYINFFPEILRLLAPGGVLMCDNVLYRGFVIPGSTFHRRKKTIVVRLRNFLRELNSNPTLTTTVLPIGDGVAVTYKEGNVHYE